MLANANLFSIIILHLDLHVLPVVRVAHIDNLFGGDIFLEVIVVYVDVPATIAVCARVDVVVM